MPLYRVQHAFKAQGGSSLDDYVNNFHIWHPTQVLDDTANEAYSAGVATMIKAFYDSEASVYGALRLWLHPRTSALRVIKIYSAGTAPPNLPLWQQEEMYPGLDVPEIQGLPEECSVVLSLKALAVGVNPRRSRGRIYLGPFNTAAVDSVPTIYGPTRVDPVLINCILGQATGLNASLNSGGYEWRIYSPTNNASYKIDYCSCDDAFDTIRNRGTAPSARLGNSLP